MVCRARARIRDVANCVDVGVKGSDTDFLADGGKALDQSNHADRSVKERLDYAIE